jgi:hypothetical protein
MKSHCHRAGDHGDGRGVKVGAATTGLPVGVATAIVLGEATTMGDKSPKSKQRDEKQKDAAKAAGAAAAISKQASQSHAPTLPGKGKK